MASEVSSLISQCCDPWNPALRDPADGRYIRDFLLDEAGDAVSFFKEFGFVVFKDILSPEECKASADAILQLFEKGTDGKFRREDPSTWGHFPQGGMEQFGLPSRKPAMIEQFLRNRASQRVHEAFARLLGEEDLLTNHDRVCFQRPTMGEHGSKRWATRSNLHLDMNPWHYLSEDGSARRALDYLDYSSMTDLFAENNSVFASDGLFLQGTLNFLDNHEDDGGYQCVPGFSRIFREVFGSVPMPREQHDAPSWKFHGDSPVPLPHILQHQMRVPMRAGSLVLWDQRTPHGSRRNFSVRPRFAQFLKLFPRRFVNEIQLRKRAALINDETKRLQIPEGVRCQRVFGLDVLPANGSMTAQMPLAPHEPSVPVGGDRELDKKARRRWGKGNGGQIKDAT